MLGPNWVFLLIQNKGNPMAGDIIAVAVHERLSDNVQSRVTLGVGK